MNGDDIEDMGYRNGINDVVSWHMNEVSKLAEAIKKAYVEVGDGRRIQIGVVWEGQFCNAEQLIGLAQFHTDCAKAIRKQLLK